MYAYQIFHLCDSVWNGIKDYASEMWQYLLVKFSFQMILDGKTGVSSIFI